MNKKNQTFPQDQCIYTCISFVFMVNVGKDTIPGSYGIAFDTQNLRLVKFKGILIYEGGGSVSLFRGL